MGAEAVEESGDGAPLAVIRRYLASGNELLRSAAARALPAVVDDPRDRRAVLVDALLDPDPDVRSDAMTALERVARPEDAGTIRRSLEGDPVREVKLAAVRALARLNDRDSVELLRSLVLSRSDDRVAWEDEAGDWEDWLDVQVAAIAALGEMGVGAAIGDLLAARADEFGQTLDVQVFDALGRIGPGGVERLLAVIRDEDGIARRRAADALARVAPEMLAPHIDTLLAADDPRLRAIAVTAMAADDARAHARVTRDPDAGVRLAALRRAAPLEPGLAVRALSDRDAAVQAAALDLLPVPPAPALRQALVENMTAWLDTAAPVLMTAAARHLPVLAPDRAEAPLRALIADAARPLEARIAAVTALGAGTPAIATGVFAGLLANPAQQVRTAALVVLRDRARAGDPAAVDTVAAAIAGTLSGDAAPAPRDDPDGPDVSAPKGEGAGARPIRITPEGDIVAMDLSVDAANRSTLASILDGNAAPNVGMAEDTPEETGVKRRRRRAVEGSMETASALAHEAMRTCADLGLAPIEAAVLSRLDDAPDHLRRAAWQALARHCDRMGAGEAARSAARAAVADADAVVRVAAFTILTGHDPDPDLVAAAARDPDPLLRAAAIAGLPPADALDHIADDAPAVRRAAAERVLAQGSAAMVSSAVGRLLAAERVDTLAALAASSAPAAAECLRALSPPALPPRKALVLLNAFADLQGVTA